MQVSKMLVEVPAVHSLSTVPRTHFVLDLRLPPSVALGKKEAFMQEQSDATICGRKHFDGCELSSVVE